MKTIKNGLMILAVIVTVLGIWIFTANTLQGNLPFKDFGETTGTALELIMGFQMILFFGMLILKHNWYPTKLKAYVVTGVKFLRTFHRETGFLGISLLLLHFSLVWDKYNWMDFHLLTGYFTTLFLILSLCFSFQKNKNGRRLHVIFAWIAVIPFLLHIL